MTSFKALSSAFAVSMAVHGLLGYVVALPWGPALPPGSESIQIEVVQAQVPETKPALPRKRVRGIPVPRAQAAPRTEAPSKSDFQKAVDEKIKKQLSQLQRLEAPLPEPRISSSITSAELIADPVKGKIFVGYFGQVKKKIQSIVFQKTGRNLYGRGSVCLEFVLNAEGGLEHLAVLDKGTQSDESMKVLAAQCIRDSAPFDSFPKDLGPRRIFFNITIFFDAS